MKLENWYWNGARISGNVYGNPEFSDGTYITTSTVAVFLNSESGKKQIVTRNSTYALGEENVGDFIDRELT